MSKNIYQKIERGEVSICQTCIHRLVCRAIDNQPCTECNHYQNAADVAPVRHGRWIGLEYDSYADGSPVYDLWECSECGEEVRGEDVPDTHPWCHACGALMDRKENEHG